MFVALMVQNVAYKIFLFIFRNEIMKEIGLKLNITSNDNICFVFGGGVTCLFA